MNGPKLAGRQLLAAILRDVAEALANQRLREAPI
jgi:hypothetical protein